METVKDEEFLKRFGMRLRLLRVARRLSQEKFGEACGLNQTYISGIERGKRNVTLISLRAIAQALKVPLAELFQELE